MNFCYDMLLGVKIGFVLNIVFIYLVFFKLEDIVVVFNYNVIWNWFYLDMVVYGCYNMMVWVYMKEKGYMLFIEDGDMEIL